MDRWLPEQFGGSRVWKEQVASVLDLRDGSLRDLQRVGDGREADAYNAQREAERARKEAVNAAREPLKEARRVAGSIDGQFWPLLRPSIAELKRQERFDEARDLLAKCIGAAEGESAATGEVPDLWPTEQISVVLRRLREHPNEVAYLERYIAACGDRDIPESVTMRLSLSRLAAERGGEVD